MTQSEEIKVSIWSDLLKDMDSLIPGVYLSREELAREALRYFVMCHEQKKRIPVCINHDTAMKIDMLCNETGKDPETIIDEAIENYKKEPLIEEKMPEIFCYFDRFLNDYNNIME